VEIASALTKLMGDLPPPSEVSIGDHTDRQARAALALIVKAAIDQRHEREPEPDDPGACPNCGKRMAGETSPYCSEVCRSQAAFVRQFRRNLQEESVFDHERQAAMGQVMWHILGGGYPRRNKMVPESAKRKLLAMACANCGASATTFDHKGSACNRTSNLQPMCALCSVTQEFGDAEFLARPAVQMLLSDLAARIASPTPLKLCDDPDQWNWRTFISNRKSAVTTGTGPSEVDLDYRSTHINL
jgi:hypothetical protein